MRYPDLRLLVDRRVPGAAPLLDRGLLRLRPLLELVRGVDGRGDSGTELPDNDLEPLLAVVLVDRVLHRLRIVLDCDGMSR